MSTIFYTDSRDTVLIAVSFSCFFMAVVSVVAAASLISRSTPKKVQAVLVSLPAVFLVTAIVTLLLALPNGLKGPDFQAMIEEQLDVRIVGEPDLDTGRGTVTDVRMEVGNNVQDCFIEGIGGDAYNVACRNEDGVYSAPPLRTP